jgi:hypothetical protein
VAWELVRSGHLVRSLRLAPLATGVASVAAFLAVRRGDTHAAVADLRVLGLLLALGCGFVLDDSAAATLQASPYGLARRLGLRISIAVAVVVPVWSGLLALLLRAVPAGERWSIGLGLSVELAAVLAMIWAMAGWGRRRGFEHPGLATTPALLASLLVVSSIQRAPMLVGPGSEWTAAHLRWSGVLVAAAGALTAATRDPAGRRRRLRLR